MKQIVLPNSLKAILLSSSIVVINSAQASEKGNEDLLTFDDNVECKPISDMTDISDFEDSSNCGCGSGGVCNSGCNGSC